MASHGQLLLDYQMLLQTLEASDDNFTHHEVMLAAEVGRSLLERNEELEKEITSLQETIEDQSQQIQWLTNQRNLLRDERMSRSKFYENLEATLFELERTNTSLSSKHEVDKKRILNLTENLEYLERKCEEMTGTLESIRNEHRKRRRMSSLFFHHSDEDEEEPPPLIRRSHSLHDIRDLSRSPSPESDDNNSSTNSGKLESDVESLELKIEELRRKSKRDGERIAMLENQLKTLVQENNALEDDLKRLKEEKEVEVADLRSQLLEQTPRKDFKVCRRCSEEISFMSQVNSIDEDYSSLEMELRAASSVDEEDSVLLKDNLPECPSKAFRRSPLPLPRKIHPDYPNNLSENDEDEISPTLKEKPRLWWLAWGAMLLVIIGEFVWALGSLLLFLSVAPFLSKSRVFRARAVGIPHR